ncbi:MULTISPECIES: hypothetical protein [Amycolatopsis]|uniref:hypothetical protein n=1 Tax=Amycolatopsis TaxID=1813 RepID=UPI001178C6E9|nr:MULTISPECIES: hypothetical protein [Amycolatopsis]
MIVYMQNENWDEGPEGPAGSLWFRDGASVAVPRFDDQELVRGTLERIAKFENKDSADLSDSIRYYRMDVTNFRSLINRGIVDTIPLDSAVNIVSSIRTLFRCSGMTAYRPQADLKSGYSRSVRDFTRQAGMGHTKRGSFVFPVVIPLGETEIPTPAEPTLVEVTRSAPEPYERRIVRTLAQSLKAVEEVVIQPGREPTLKRLHDAVEAGVSRQLCSALVSITSDSVVTALDAQFSWGGIVPPARNSPKQVVIPAESRDLLSKAAEKLREVRVEPARVFSGSIVELRHEENDPVGYVTISTPRNGRMSEIRVQLPYSRYQDALRWHSDSRPVLVEGDVVKDKGRLVVNEPIRCHPIDELYLTSN